MCTEEAAERVQWVLWRAALLRGRTVPLSRGLASSAPSSPDRSECPGGSGSRVGGGQSLEPGLRGPAAAGRRGRAGRQLLQLSHLNELLNCYFYFSSNFHYKKIICCSSPVKCERKI